MDRYISATEQDVLDLIEKYIDVLNIKSFKIIEIPFEELKVFHYKNLDWYKIFFEQNLSKLLDNVDFSCNLNYNENKIILILRCIMKDTFTIKIPYGYRNKYIDMIKEINSLVDENGCVIGFVNNNPYNLDCCIAIETDNNIDEIKEIIKRNNLKEDNSKGIDELLKELAYRKWDCMSFTRDNDCVEHFFKKRFLFPEKSYFQ